MALAAVLCEVLVALVWTVYYCLETAVKMVVPEQFFYKDIKGQIVLLTGGGSGIGRLMALKLAKLGAVVVTWDINTKGNEETGDMIKKEGGKAIAYTVDMSSRDEIYAAAEKVKTEVGKVDILINNAGIVSGSSFLDTPDQKIIRTFDVNTLAHFWTLKAFLPAMIEKKAGHVVNIASLAGQSGTNKLVDYCSSKFAAVGLDESLRVELFVQGHSDYVKTTVVCPYYISTGMFSGVQSKLIPILEPGYVAERAVAAILTNAEVCILPAWTFILIAIKCVLPPPAFMLLSQAFGINCSMDQFTGRGKKD